MSRGTLIISVIATTFALAGCGTSNSVSQLEGNEASLREMVANDRQQIESLQERLSRQEDRIAELEHSRAESAAPAARSSIAANGAGPAPAGTPSMSEAPGEAPETAGAEGAETPPGSAAGEAAPGSAGAASPPEAVALAPPPAAPPNPAPAPATAAPSWQTIAAREIAAPPNDPGAKLYQAGLAEMRAGRYQAALSKFQDLQRRYPKSRLSEPAEYFSGNALYELGQHEKSILQFNDLTMRFPSGRFASASLLREAQAFEQINDQIDARLTLQKLLNDHPDSPEAPAARSMIASLSS